MSGTEDIALNIQIILKKNLYSQKLTVGWDRVNTVWLWSKEKARRENLEVKDGFL